MVIEYQLRAWPPASASPVAVSPSRRFYGSRSAQVPAAFRCRRSSRGIPFGTRGPALPYRRGPLRWVVGWAARSYLSAVWRGSGFRRAIAWRFLAVFAPSKWAHTYVWWVRQVTEPAAI